MTQTTTRPDPISLLGFSMWISPEPHWDAFHERTVRPWLQHQFWLCLGRLSLVLRVHLPWVKP